jgi:hypothetical protein
MQAGKPGSKAGPARPSREALAAAVRASVARGWSELADSRGYCSSVARLECDGVPLVVKAPAGRRPRFVWRYLLRREWRAYEALGEVAGVPRCFGLVDGQYLVLERIEAVPYRQAVLADPERFHQLLFELVERLHERGVAHGDLKKKENLLVTPDERPVALDFATAFVYRPGFAPLNHLLYATTRRFDYHAWLKHKYRRDLSRLSPEDAAYHRPSRVERFNRWLVHDLLPRTRPRYRQTLADRGGAAAGEASAGGLAARWRAWRAWRRARRSPPLHFGARLRLRGVDGDWIGVAEGGRLVSCGDEGSAAVLRFVAEGREGEPVAYGSRLVVSGEGGESLVHLASDGEGLVMGEAAAEGPDFVVFDPTSRFREGEPLKPGLALSLATPDQQRRWLLPGDDGAAVVASRRYLRRSSTFFAAPLSVGKERDGAG